jgi:hypothetical protein
MSQIKIWKEDSELETKVREIESLMKKHGIELHYTYNGLSVMYKEKLYPIIELDSREKVTSFPRSYESERLLDWTVGSDYK